MAPNSTASLICLVFAFVLFCIAGFGYWRTPAAPGYYPSTIAAGLAFWVLATLLPMILSR